jgi:SAM-dependent methyltransferase
MNLKQSDAPASPRFSSQRKRDLLDHFEINGDELDRWREFNAAYHEDDRKFMQFLIPLGKRVLELGCGRGDLLAALKPSYGVGIDFAVAAVAYHHPPSATIIPLNLQQLEHRLGIAPI